MSLTCRGRLLDETLTTTTPGGAAMTCVTHCQVKTWGLSAGQKEIATEFCLELASFCVMYNPLSTTLGPRSFAEHLLPFVTSRFKGQAFWFSSTLYTLATLFLAIFLSLLSSWFCLGHWTQLGFISCVFLSLRWELWEQFAGSPLS